MAVSRSSREFLERAGLQTPTIPPASRLAITELLVHTVPLENPPGPIPTILQAYEGEPPTDRGVTQHWPNQ